MKKKLSKKQLSQLKEQIVKLSNVSADELAQQIKDAPDGVIAAQACCNMLFDEYFDEYLPAPTRGDMSDEDYQARIQSYQNIRESMRSMAFYWYIVGTNHPKHMERLIELLDNTPEGQSNQ